MFISKRPGRDSNMAKIPLYKADGAGAGEIEVKDEIFSVPVKEHLVHTAVTAYMSNLRRGQSRAKTRREVRGGGAKPWRQKGTGRARAGTINSPLWRHGGVAHGPVARDYTMRLPRKMLRGALASALTSKASSGRIMAVENFLCEEPKTRKAAGFIKTLNLAGNILFVAEGFEENHVKSFRNIGGVTLRDAMSLNVYDVVGAEWLVLFRGGLDVLQERLSNEKSE